MKFYYSPSSPFVRKVEVAARETGLMDRITLEPVTVTPVAPSDKLMVDNPLSKVPCLVTDDGLSLVDSRVICEYLDSLHDGKKLIPAEPGRRWRVLRLAALADEAMDAAVLTRYETFVRPEDKRWQPWIDNQLAKVTRTLDHVEPDAGRYMGHLCIGTISLACLLGYLDFRYADLRWREGRPALARWFEEMSARPSMQATVPK
ncbi:MAG: glutathione S-transferase [Geminicoccaceae bacterium]|nr:glutathione S-transferase [Geminicoccaceae bacterium]